MTRADEILKWVTGPKVLDVGCTDHSENIGTTHGIGSPYWLHGRLRSTFPILYGIDIAAENVSFLREQGYDNLFVQSAEAFALPEKFDTIVAGELIEHLGNPGLFLQRCREHLEPGGRVILTTPSPFAMMNLLYGVIKYPRTCSNDEHACWFCPQTMSSLAARHGFMIEYFEPIEDYLPGVESWKYRAFLLWLRLAKTLLPKRLRGNTVLYVLKVRSDPLEVSAIAGTGSHREPPR